jgi:hypothetical protein
MFRNFSSTNVVKRHEKMLSGVALCMSITFIWLWIFNLISISAWQIPLGYGGDGWLNMAFAKAYMDGDIFPVLFQSVQHLNAPFIANWNDYPITEELVYAIMGWLGRLIGLFAAFNFMLLLAQLLAGMSFWYVARELKYRPAFAFAGAILYAFSHYIFSRGLGHLVLTYCWHVPLMLLVTWWAYSAIPVQIKSKKFVLAGGISFISGTFNPYYTGMFLQFLVFAVLLHIVRKQFRNLKFPLVMIMAALSGFLMMNADSIIYSLINGPNFQAVGRNLASVELYALKIPDLIFTPGYHRWSAWENFSQQHYYGLDLIKGEFWSPYLGFVGLTGLAWLMTVSFYRFLQGKFELITVQFWQTVWILFYSIVGGFNLLIASFGFMLFRATNRYSIFILAISLLFLLKQLSRICPNKLVLPVSLLLILIGVWDQVPARHKTSRMQEIAAIVQSDRNFSENLESHLPKGSMVFQLPFAEFPEIGPINKMGDYEHFRPYLFTKDLRYTYGTNKGRGDNTWQLEVAKLPPTELAAKLESYGFGAIIINRNGYEDNGNSIISALVASNRKIISANNDLVAVGLNTNASPVYPDPWPIFSTGWSADEKTHRWSESEHAEILIFNYTDHPKNVLIGFTLSTLMPRKIKIQFNSTTLAELSMGIHSASSQFKPTAVTLSPGKNIITIDTDMPPMSPGGGDPRELSFQISNFSLN